MSGEADIVKIAETDPSNAQDKYYRFMLMKAKLEASGANAADVKATIGNVSELEQLRMDILKEIVQYKTSTPEFAQLYNLTGSKDTFDQADWLATRIFEQQEAETIMSYYTPTKADVRSRFTAASTAAITTRQTRIAAVNAATSSASVASQVAAALAALRPA